MAYTQQIIIVNVYIDNVFVNQLLHYLFASRHCYITVYSLDLQLKLL